MTEPALTTANDAAAGGGLIESAPGRGRFSKGAESRFWLLLVVVAGAAAYLPWLGSYGPIDPTDSFFLESGREMVETGKFLMPLNH